MDRICEDILRLFESGRLSRRDAAKSIAGLVLVLTGAGRRAAAQGTEPAAATFSALDLNHFALRVTGLDASQRFYEEHLGMKLIRKLPAIRFLSAGPNFVGLFRSDDPGLDHVAFSIDPYDQADAVGRLERAGVEYRTEMERTFFFDPDGIQLQVTEYEHWPAQGQTRPAPEL